MGLVRGMTTINTRKRKASKKNAKSNAEHEKWLMRMGVHPSQLKKTKGINKIPSYKTRETLPTSDKIMPIDPYQGLSREEKIAATQNFQLGQMYNKGGLQVMSKQDDITKGRRRV